MTTCPKPFSIPLLQHQRTLANGLQLREHRQAGGQAHQGCSMSAAQHAPGHRLEMDRPNGVAYKPRCACGWVGRATDRTGARSQYDSHKRAIAKGNAS